MKSTDASEQHIELRPLTPEETIQRLRHILQLLESIKSVEYPLPKARVLLRGVIGCGIESAKNN